MANTHNNDRQEAIIALSAAVLIPELYKVLQEIAGGLSDSSESSTSSSSSTSNSSISINENEVLLQALDILLNNRYLHYRRYIPKSPKLADLILHVYKHHYKREFRKYTRMNPQTFDTLVQCLEGQSVFQNHSSSGQQQLEVLLQVLITLIRVGHYGNGAASSKIALMCGVGTGTVDLCTRRVFEAIQSSELQSRHIRWPTEAEREEAKQQIEQKCRLPEWRHGWCIVDGTLVPLFQKPTFYGEAFFDRKSNYSMNVQIINTPNGQIIDFASGFRGSRNDRHCFKFTRLWNDHEVLLNEGE